MKTKRVYRYFFLFPSDTRGVTRCERKDICKRFSGVKKRHRVVKRIESTGIFSLPRCVRVPSDKVWQGVKEKRNITGATE